MVRSWSFGKIRGPTMVSNLPTLFILTMFLSLSKFSKEVYSKFTFRKLLCSKLRKRK